MTTNPGRKVYSDLVQVVRTLQDDLRKRTALSYPIEALVIEDEVWIAIYTSLVGSRIEFTYTRQFSLDVFVIDCIKFYKVSQVGRFFQMLEETGEDPNQLKQPATPDQTRPLNQLGKKAMEISLEKGLLDHWTTDGQLARLHSEVSEALEEWQHDRMETAVTMSSGEGDVLPKPIGFPIELADIVISVAKLAALHDIDLDYAVAAKLAFNAHRPKKHGKVRP